MASFRPFFWLFFLMLSCQRAAGGDNAAPAGTSSAQPAASPATPAGNAAPSEKIPSNAPAGGQASADRSHARLYTVVDFTVLRKLKILEEKAVQVRAAAARQGLLGKLISCGADPFSSLDRVQAVLPSDFRRNLQGSVTASGTFDAGRVRACLADAFQKENYRHETRKDADIFTHPRITFEISSPKPGQLAGISQNWTEKDFPPDIAELFAQLGAGQAIYVGSRGAILPKHPEITAMAIAFSPAQDSLSIQGRLLFSRGDAAAVLHAAVLAQLENRRRNLASSSDPRMQAAAGFLEKLVIRRENDRIVLSISIPYADVPALLSLFNLKIHKTF